MHRDIIESDPLTVDDENRKIKFPPIGICVTIPFHNPDRTEEED
jgi:hypothetical protein